MCCNLTHPHCVKVSRGCSFSYGHPISWGSTHTAVYKPLVTDWWTFPKMNGTNAVLGKMIVFSGRKILTEHKSHLVPICFWVKQKHHGIMFIMTLRNISPEEEKPIKSMFFWTVRVCVCVPGRIWLWQNVVNNGPSIEATRQDIQRDLGTWTARYVHLLLQGGAPYSYGP